MRPIAERDQLVEQYLPLVRYVVARLPVTLPGSLDRDDFYSVGVIGLMHAASTFDPNRGASFKTFAYTAIRGAILDEVRKHDPVPRNRRDRLRKMDRANSALWAQFDREPTLTELATAMGCSEQELDEDLQALHTSRMLSLDEQYGDEDGGSSMVSRMRDAGSADPGQLAEGREQLDQLAKAIAELPETDRHVVVLYFHEQLFLKEIGQLLGVTESRVSQILTRATERLRLKMKERD
ncbi:MAG: FliA/WhiG family RNA polymerase sigma factor [Planctomycetes bacterium]|jgi:RNA polymerase sigma factor for flagellar operon FliA|nr:FliA/WhiG family RNA polymerase sigma factor [Planctomycetota bacterium]